MFIDEAEAAAQLLVKSSAIARVKEEQQRDEIGKQVVNYCKDGWPVYKTDAK